MTKPTKAEIEAGIKAAIKVRYETSTKVLFGKEVEVNDGMVEMITAALEAAYAVRDCKGCLNYSGLEEDLNALIDVCQRRDIDVVRDFIKMNYPQGHSTICNRGWQPIETAPKDGTTILASSKKYSTIGYFYAENENFTDCIDCSSIGEEPTHWQHLPSKPI